ncbi:Transposase, partial [Caligus rogercresseyi]
RWHTEFDKGVFALEKKTRPGRPRETRTEENVSRVKRLVEDNPRQFAAEVSLPSTTVFRLLTEDLGLRYFLSVLVPHQLSEANKAQRVKCCQDLLKLFQDHGEDFLGYHLLVQDESWFYWDSAERRQVWAEPTGPRFSTPVRGGIDHCTSCRDHSRPEHNERVPEDDWEAFSQPEKGQDPAERLSPHVDNARPHTATDTREFLTRRDVEPVKQSPYSPSLNLCDRFLFRKLKHLLREDEFGARGGYTRRSAGDEEA